VPDWYGGVCLFWWCDWSLRELGWFGGAYWFDDELD